MTDRTYHISTFLPTQCGIATYTEDLIKALAGNMPLRARMLYETDADVPGPDCVIHINDPESYRAAAARINASEAAVVSLQHEFGIFGGERGNFVKLLVDQLQKPLVTTFHTVTPLLSPPRQEIIGYVTAKSSGVVVLSESNAAFLHQHFGVPEEKLHVIRHGVPETPFVAPADTPLRRRLNAPLVFFSMGHLRRSKGYKYALRSLARFKEKVPDFKYIIAGTYQEQNGEGEEMRQKLNELIDGLGLRDNVIWGERFLPMEEVLEHIKASDIGLVTYTGVEQSSSGVLPLVLSCGRPVIATAFEYAVNLKSVVGDCLEIAALNDYDSIVQSIEKLASPQADLPGMMRAAYDRTRTFVWPRVGEKYLQAFRQAAASFT